MMRKPLGRGLDALIGNAAPEFETGADNETGAAVRNSSDARSEVSSPGLFSRG